MTLAGFVHAAIIFLAIVYAVNLPLLAIIRNSWTRLATATLIASILVFLPLPWMDSLYLFLAGFLWPVSAALAVGLPYRLLAGRGGPFAANPRDDLLFGLVTILCGLMVLPGSLFPALPEIYNLGYAGPFVPTLMGAILLLALLMRSWLLTVWIALAAIWSLAGINPGVNLWDSLIDPVAFVGAAVIFVIDGIVLLRRRQAAGEQIPEQSGR